jgi:heat shock protein HtpX
MRLLGVEPYLNANGLNLTSLLIFAAVMGFGGSFISLAISKWSAKRAMGVQVIETPTNSTEFWLLETVRKYSAKAGIKMPEVGIFDTPEVNAFATGMSRNSSLVAVSSGLLQQMSKREAEAVIGHEIAHVANGDMVTLALIQGVVNTFVMFLSRVIGHLVDRVVFKTERGHGPAFFVTMIVAELVLGVLASIIVMWFSRQREFHADRGGAAPRRAAAHDRRAGAAELAASRAPAGQDGGLRHQRRWRRRHQAPVHDPPAAGRTHRGAAQQCGARMKPLVNTVLPSFPLCLYPGARKTNFRRKLIA